MAQNNPIEHAENTDHADDASTAVETDWSAVSAEVASGTPARDATAQPFIHELQDRVQSALTGVDVEADAAAEIWSPRRRLAFFVGANVLCWALILLPVLL